MYVCMHVFMYMYVCMYACMHVCMYVCMYVCMCLFVCACMHVSIYACMHACGDFCKYINISFVQSDKGSTLPAPAPLPRIPGFSPATTTGTIASARAPTVNNPAPPARRRSASFSFEPDDVDVPLADSLLVDLRFLSFSALFSELHFLCFSLSRARARARSLSTNTHTQIHTHTPANTGGTQQAPDDEMPGPATRRGNAKHICQDRGSDARNFAKRHRGQQTHSR